MDFKSNYPVVVGSISNAGRKKKHKFSWYYKCKKYAGVADLKGDLATLLDNCQISPSAKSKTVYFGPVLNTWI